MKITIIFVLFFQFIGCSQPFNTKTPKQEKIPGIKFEDHISKIKKILINNGISEQQSEQFIKDNPIINTLSINNLKELINESKQDNKLNLKELSDKIKIKDNNDLSQEFIDKHGKYIIRGKMYCKGVHELYICRLQNDEERPDVFINNVDVSNDCYVKNFKYQYSGGNYQILSLNIDQNKDDIIDVIICFKKHTPHLLRRFIDVLDDFKYEYLNLNFKYYSYESIEPFNVFINHKLMSFTTYKNHIIPDSFDIDYWDSSVNSDGTITYFKTNKS